MPSAGGGIDLFEKKDTDAECEAELDVFGTDSALESRVDCCDDPTLNRFLSRAVVSCGLGIVSRLGLPLPVVGRSIATSTAPTWYSWRFWKRASDEMMDRTSLYCWDISFGLAIHISPALAYLYPKDRLKIQVLCLFFHA